MSTQIPSNSVQSSPLTTKKRKFQESVVKVALKFLDAEWSLAAQAMIPKFNLGPTTLKRYPQARFWGKFFF